LFNIDDCRMFVCSHSYCGIKVIKMRINSSAAVWLAWSIFFLPVVGLGCRTVLLVDCFMCMVNLVLRITYGQVVLLRTVLNFVAYN
jgi:hypothetical protein